MTRRTGSGRVTRPDQPAEAEARAYPSLRQRQPVAYWLAILGVVALVVSTIAGALAAIFG